MAFKNVVLMNFILFAAIAVAEEPKDLNKDGMAEMMARNGEDPKAEVEAMKQESKVTSEKLDEDKNGKLSQAEPAKEVEPEDKAESSEPEEAAMEAGSEEDDMEAGAADAAEPEAEVSAMEEVAEDDDVEAGADADEDPEAEESAREEGAEEDDVEAGADDDEDPEAPVSFLQHVADEDDAEAAEQMANQMMEDLDLDKDGQLSLTEFAAGEQAEAADTEEKEESDQIKKDMQEDFTSADKDKNGKLSKEEVQAMHAMPTGETFEIETA
jgi:hypothetical protein